MKILILNWRDIKNPRAGGAEVLTHELAKGWVAAGHEVTFFSSFFKGAKKRENVDGVNIIRAGNALSIYWQAYVYYNNEFKGKFDLIIDEINTIPFFTPFYVCEPVICHINQLAKEVWFYESHLPMSLLGYLAEPLILRSYRNKPVITISESTKEDLLKLGFRENKIFIIPMGIDFAPLERISQKEETPTLIYVGRIKKSKRIDHAIRAFKLVKERIADCKLWIIGNGNTRYKNSLKRLIARYNLEGVTFYEKITDEKKLELMKRAHAIIVTSVREGWGLIVTEANAVGTPAICYNVPGLRDSTIDNVTGLFCKRNNPSNLAKTILNFLENKNLRDSLSKTALDKSRNFSWDRTNKESWQVLEQISNDENTK